MKKEELRKFYSKLEKNGLDSVTISGYLKDKKFKGKLLELVGLSQNKLIKVKVGQEKTLFINSNPLISGQGSIYIGLLKKDTNAGSFRRVYIEKIIPKEKFQVSSWNELINLTVAEDDGKE